MGLEGCLDPTARPQRDIGTSTGLDIWSEPNRTDYGGMVMPGSPPGFACVSLAILGTQCRGSALLLRCLEVDAADVLKRHPLGRYRSSSASQTSVFA